MQAKQFWEMVTRIKRKPRAFCQYKSQTVCSTEISDWAAALRVLQWQQGNNADRDTQRSPFPACFSGCTRKSRPRAALGYLWGQRLLQSREQGATWSLVVVDWNRGGPEKGMYRSPSPTISAPIVEGCGSKNSANSKMYQLYFFYYKGQTQERGTRSPTSAV